MTRISVSVSSEFHDAIELYMKEHRLKSMSEAIAELAFVGLKSGQQVASFTPHNKWGGPRKK